MLQFGDVLLNTGRRLQWLSNFQFSFDIDLVFNIVLNFITGGLAILADEDEQGEKYGLQ